MRRAESDEVEWFDPDDEADTDTNTDTGDEAEETESEETPVAGAEATDAATADGVVERQADATASPESDAVGPEGGAVPQGIETEIAGEMGRGRPLGGRIRGAMEGSFGVDFDGVRIHEGSQADRLNRSLGARAFTVGSDVFFAKGEFAPGAAAGQRLLAHELTHVVQQAGGQGSGGARRRAVIRREFTQHTVLSNAHLRDDTDWSQMKGPKIKANRVIFVDDANTKRKDTRDRIARKGGEDVRWSAALNIAPGHVGPIAPDRVGFIRSTRVRKETGPDASLVASLKSQVVDILRWGEGLYPSLAGLFVAPGRKDYDEQIDFLVKNHLRVGILGGFQGANPEQAAQAISMTATRLDRIRTGVKFLADSLEHWRLWLHSDGRTAITGLQWMQSDLHQRGLGVVKVDFLKSPGGDSSFAAKTNFSAMIKPEDKSLEQALLGENAMGDDGEDKRSAAQKINEIVGLKTPDEALTTIMMASEEHFGAIIECVNGTSARDWFKAGGAPAVKQTFHETLVFAFLAGFDDLHRDNVFWSADGRPYLIDADNVLSMNQMLQKDNGAQVQSGFGYLKDKEGNVHPDAVRYHAEAERNMAAIRHEDQTFNSKILAAMISDDAKRTKIIDALREAVEDKKGRIVPVRTQYWGDLLNSYPAHQDTAAVVDRHAAPSFIVHGRDPEKGDTGGDFDPKVGPGLKGMVGEGDETPVYLQATEKQKLREDFDSGAIPFYEYEFASGDVYHNGVVVYHGVDAVDAAFDIIDKKFPGSLI